MTDHNETSAALSTGETAQYIVHAAAFSVVLYLGLKQTRRVLNRRSARKAENNASE